MDGFIVADAVVLSGIRSWIIALISCKKTACHKEKILGQVTFQV